MARLIDTMTTPDTYQYHRQLIRLTGADAQIPVAQMTVRVASSSGAVDTSKVTEWPGGSLPPHVAGYQQGFFSRYMDPTEDRAQLDRLAAEFPNLVTAVNLPNLTPGYQRKAQTVVGGWAGTGAQRSSPFTNQTGSLAAAEAPKAVVLTSKAWGHEGGNGITAQLVAGRCERAACRRGRRAGDQGHARHRRRRRREHHRGAGRRGDRRQPRRERARHGPDLPRQRGGRDPAPSGEVQTLKDFLNAPAHVQRGPFQQRVYRIGAHRDGSKVGVFITCQVHAREWTTGLTCLETAERLVRNYATDPETKKLLDNTEVFIRANGNPDGGHYSMYDFASLAAQPVQPLRREHQQRPARAQHLGRRPQPQLHRVHALRRRLGRRLPGLHGRQLLGPVGGLRARDQERHVGHGHVPEHQVREQHARLRRLLHVVPGRLPRRRQADHVAGAEHRRREVLLPGGREDPRPHQGDPRDGHPARAHGPDRGRPVLGRRQLGR